MKKKNIFANSLILFLSSLLLLLTSFNVSDLIRPVVPAEVPSGNYHATTDGGHRGTDPTELRGCRNERREEERERERERERETERDRERDE